jgi:PIF1-like helicase
MFKWGTYDKSQYDTDAAPKLDAQKRTMLRTFYESVDVFVIDEVNAMSASMLALVHDTMMDLFNPNRRKTRGEVLPFGGKKMIFLGDPAQLKPVVGEPIYGGGMGGTEKADRARSARGKRQVNYTLTARGQELYRKYLEPNCIVLCRGQRSAGLLQQICDRIRTGRQTDDDRVLLLRQALNYPELKPDYTVHYENDSCFSTNWRNLWSECQASDPPKRLYICRASYYTTGDNDVVVDGLAVLPAKHYTYAADTLCVSEGCDVRLIRNINVEAGLVNSSTGRVVRVIYDHADVSALLTGKHPPPYCIVVEFPDFKGFPSDTEERVHPFPHKLKWVPIYRERFTPLRCNVPSWIIKKQTTARCWREQFPLDLCRAITSHRAQGQTFADCSVGVNLDLNNPDKRLPSDIRSVLYVALTRATQLKVYFYCIYLLDRLLAFAFILFYHLKFLCF